MKEKKVHFEYLLTLVVVLLLNYVIAGIALCAPCKDTVYTGETMREVAAKCGEPSLKDQRVMAFEDIDKDGTHRVSINIEEWTYDPGPNELVQTYHFENGSLTEISTNGYGTARDFSIDLCRDGAALAVGDSIAQTYLKCGTPLEKRNIEEKTIESETNGVKHRTIFPVVEWTYRYGRDLPGYTITFENGQATAIRTREFGK